MRERRCYFQTIALLFFELLFFVRRKKRRDDCYFQCDRDNRRTLCVNSHYKNWKYATRTVRAIAYLRNLLIVISEIKTNLYNSVIFIFYSNVLILQFILK